MATSNAKLNIITPPIGVPVSIDEVKDSLKVTSTTEDARIYGMIEMATKWAEEYTGLKIMPQTVELTMDKFIDWSFTLGVWPIQSVDSVKYDDTESPQVEQTLTADVDYDVDIVTTKGRISTLGGWPSVSTDYNAVRIRMTAGYASAKVVPEGIKEGIKLMIMSTYYCKKEMYEAAKAMLWIYRVNV